MALNKTLLIDVGNTAIKACLLSDITHVSSSIYIQHDVEQVFHELFADMFDGVEEVWVASVATSQINGMLEKEIATHSVGIKVHYVNSAPVLGGVRNGYQNPSQIGVDRLLAMVAGSKEGRETCVIDAGTAVTIDVVNASLEHLGGWILPGRSLIYETLVKRSAKITPKPQPIGVGLGRNTQDALSHGVRFSWAGGVEQALDVLLNQTPDMTVVCGGGDAVELASLVKRVDIVEPNLVLNGLSKIVRKINPYAD